VGQPHAWNTPGHSRHIAHLYRGGGGEELTAILTPHDQLITTKFLPHSSSHHVQNSQPQPTIYIGLEPDPSPLEISISITSPAEYLSTGPPPSHLPLRIIHFYVAHSSADLCHQLHPLSMKLPFNYSAVLYLPRSSFCISNQPTSPRLTVPYLIAQLCSAYSSVFPLYGYYQ
jgi:hypothetical protein